LLVEDEVIVAMDLQQRLTRLGYEVVGTAVSGEEAIQRAGALAPDLILMDIRLRGPMDGIAAAATIRQRFHIPVVYLTAHSDTATLTRAKVTEPFGYLLKSVEDRAIQSVVEIALYKHQIDRKLRKMERWLATTLSSIGDGVITTDLNRLVTYMNPVAEGLTGWSVEDARGQVLEEVFALFYRDTQTPVEIPLQQVLEEGIVLGIAEDAVLRTRAGQVLPIDDSLAPLRDERDQITGVVIVFRDVTAQRAAQEALYHTEAQLHHVQKIEALGQLAGGVAHNFNNLMTLVLGYSDLLLADQTQRDPGYTKIEQIRQAAESAAVLSQQLLAFGRKQFLHPQLLDVNDLVSRVATMLRQLLREDMRLEMALAPHLAMVTVDPVQLEQILLNLATNARDAMPRGGTFLLSTAEVVLDAKDTRQYLDVRPGRYARLTVRDTGVGMDQETLAQIFEPFFTTKEVGKGTGLGLSTVHGIVKQSGGHITVASAPGEGTAFTIYLPIAEDAPSAAAVSPRPANPSGTETILVVDDNPLVLSLVVTILCKLGYTVLEASTSIEALQTCASYPSAIHLLITDIVMPEVSGPELAVQLLAMQPGLKVLYISGYAERTLAFDCVLQAGGGFLQKPFTPAALAEKVRDTLNRETSAGTEMGASRSARAGMR
jgi:PAS domain S-box-containing protein